MSWWDQLIAHPGTGYVLTALGTLIATLFGARVLSRRGTVTFETVHTRFAASAQDPVLGTVQVQLQGNPVSSVWITTITLQNQSYRDFSNVITRVFSATNTVLLTESIQKERSLEHIDYSPNYKSLVFPPQGSNTSRELSEIYRNRREYVIPILNRTQIVTFTYLTTVIPGSTPIDEPMAWVDIQHEGLSLREKKRRRVLSSVLGVETNIAGLSGLIVAIVVATLGGIFIENNALIVPIVAIVSLFAQLPGAVVVRVVRSVRRWLVG